MKCFAQTLDLVDDPDAIAAYIKHHEQVWPEVIDGLRAIGITRMRIFLHGTRLFMYCEAGDDFDPARDYQAYAEDPRTREWDALMRTYQAPAPGAAEGAWWSSMQPIFDLESA